jgi:hypothetical protein
LSQAISVLSETLSKQEERYQEQLGASSVEKKGGMYTSSIGVAATTRRKYAYQYHEGEGKLSAVADVLATSFKSKGVAEEKMKDSVLSAS